jgi:hypothetical protein
MPRQAIMFPRRDRRRTSPISGGIFNDGKLTFFEGAAGVLNQSNGRVKDLRDFVGSISPTSRSRSAATRGRRTRRSSTSRTASITTASCSAAT